MECLYLMEHVAEHPFVYVVGCVVGVLLFVVVDDLEAYVAVGGGGVVGVVLGDVSV